MDYKSKTTRTTYLEKVNKIIEEIKNMTPKQEEQFKKDIEKLAEKYKSEDCNYDDIDIIKRRG